MQRLASECRPDSSSSLCGNDLLWQLQLHRALQGAAATWLELVVIAAIWLSAGQEMRVTSWSRTSQNKLSAKPLRALAYSVRLIDDSAQLIAARLSEHADAFADDPFADDQQHKQRSERPGVPNRRRW